MSEKEKKKPYVEYKCKACGEEMGIGIYQTNEEIPYADRFCRKCFLAWSTINLHLEVNYIE